MRVYLNLFLLFSLLFILSCDKERPEYIAYEDYSYLQKSNKKVLLLLKISIDTMYDNTHLEEPTLLQDQLRVYDFQSSYRNALSFALGKSDVSLDIEYGEEAQDASYKYFDYWGKSYPASVKDDGYDLVLEVRVISLLSFSLGYLNFSKKEVIRLVDAGTNHSYLRWVDNLTRQSVEKYIVLEREPKKFLSLTEDLVTMSIPRVSKYLLNKLPPPRKEDITPLLPEAEGDIEDDYGE